MGELNTFTVEEIKSMRVACDAIYQIIRKYGTDTVQGEGFDSELYNHAGSEAITKIIEAKMWLGKMLEGKGTPFPKELADKSEPVK